MASVLTIFTLPMIVSFSLAHFAGASRAVAVPVGAMMGQIFLMAGLPVALGMVVRKRRLAWALRMEPKATKIRRVGDLRLARAVRMAMAKEEGFEFRATLVAASLFGFKLCDKLEIAKFDAPTAKYDTVTIEDGERRLLQAASVGGSSENSPQLGDKGWSDNARVSYSLGGQSVQ